MNLKIAGWVLFVAGTTLGAGELFLAKYWSGEEVAAFDVYADGKSLPASSVRIEDTDLPVRLILKTEGLRRSGPNVIGRTDLGTVIDFGDAMAPQTHVYRPAGGNEKARKHFHSSTSFMPEDQQPGTWNLSVDASPGSRLEIDRISMAVRVGTRDVDRHLAWGGAILALFGLGLAITRK